VIKFLHTKKFTLNEIVAELASMYGEQTDTKKAVEYWVHQVKLARTIMEDGVKPGCPPLNDIDGRILTRFSRQSYLAVHSIAQVLGLAPATVHRHLTISLDMKPRHFRYVLTS
jgi:hypothetical protein